MIVSLRFLIQLKICELEGREMIWLDRERMPRSALENSKDSFID